MLGGLSLLDNKLPSGYILDKRYKICNLVKSGGMGTVYKAEDMLLDNRLIAIKEMQDSFATGEERRAGIDQFLSEIGVLEGFRHPNIPIVTDHFFQERDKNNYYYFVMEYIDGIDLLRYLDKYGDPGLPEKQVTQWAYQICQALEYLHNIKPPVAHRDIKPSNVIYRYKDKRVLLIDFGIARVTLPGEGYWIGTPGYAPPEQQMGKPELRSDFYALGASMHELLTGICPPENFKFTSFKEAGIKVSKEIEDFVNISLSFHPEDRAINAREMRKYLEEILGGDFGVGPLSKEFLYEGTVMKFMDSTINPLLRSLIKKYGNEAHTKFIPKRLDYYVFTLSCPTNFELIIRSSYKDRKIYFYEKQGILEKKEIGYLNPEDTESFNKAQDFINRFIHDYETFKSANWGGGEGFLGFGNIVSV